MTNILVINSIAVMLSVAHSIANVSLIGGTWHAIGYLWGAAPNVTEISPVPQCQYRSNPRGDGGHTVGAHGGQQGVRDHTLQQERH